MVYMVCMEANVADRASYTFSHCIDYNHDQAMNSLNFEQVADGIVLVNIDNPLATATISLYGGQLIEWRPKGQAAAVLWSNPQAKFEQGTAIRAGVPVCWPWFGPHPSDIRASSHGYARTSQWDLTSVLTTDTGATEVVLTLDNRETQQSGNGVSAQLQQKILIHDSLTIELTTTNLTRESIRLTEALHAYFYVSDIDNITIDGLDGCDYADTAAEGQRRQQAGNIQFFGRVDRVYLNTIARCTIDDVGLCRRINITKSGSLSTVVWNPGLETAASIKDLGPDGWRSMVCVESANALDNALCIEPGQQHTLRVTYAIEDL